MLLQNLLLICSGFWATLCKTVHPMLLDRCLSVSVCLSVTFVHCGQTAGRIKMKLGVLVGLSPGHIVLDGDPAPHSSPSPLSAHAYCGQTVAHLSNCWALVKHAVNSGRCFQRCRIVSTVLLTVGRVSVWCYCGAACIHRVRSLRLNKSHGVSTSYHCFYALVVCCFAYYVKYSLSADPVPVPSTRYRVPGSKAS